nr:unnamed protein product [Callosobruchus chinensis]
MRHLGVPGYPTVHGINPEFVRYQH